MAVEPMAVEPMAIEPMAVDCYFLVRGLLTLALVLPYLTDRRRDKRGALFTQGNDPMSTTTLKRASTTFATAARNIDHVEDIRAGLELVESLARELERRKRELRAKAIDAGLAKYDVAKRESAPAKAAYIQIHGQDAFDANKTVGTVNKFVWID